MVLFSSLAVVMLFAPEGFFQAKDVGSVDADSAHSIAAASWDSPAKRAKRSRDESPLVRQARKAQLDGEPASRGRSAPQEATSKPDASANDVAAHAPAPSRFTCPENMVMIGHKFCVDLYEAMLVEHVAGGQTRDWPFFDAPKPGVDLRAVSRAGVYPQGYISGAQAKSACESSGKRLCKPDEWKKACMGPAETIWPYGAKHEKNRCNDHGISSMHFYNKGLTDKPEDSWKWGAGGNMMDPRLNQLAGTLARTGDHTGCTNDYGLYDMVGNLHEWVDDPAGTFQGGYYLDTHLNADGCYYRTTAHDVKHADYSTGFRCCADVDDL